MKSVCIKTNNSQIIDSLLKSFEKINLEDTYISIKKFKHFNNIIIHYLGNSLSEFYTHSSNILTKCIINYYEKDLINSNINLNYFYFNANERKQILDNTINLLCDNTNSPKRYDLINNKIFEYISLKHSFYLQSFINFNLKQYINLLNDQIDIAVNKFLIDKEYLEFVNILRLYIKSEEKISEIKNLHLIYSNKNSTIIDDDKNIISCNDSINKAKYISDISFSSNDLALNTLLNLIPTKLTIHLVDGYPDEFINTIKLIFQERVIICEDCDICNIYKRKQLKK